MKKIIFLILFLTTFLSCDYSYQKQIGENYFIRCLESRERMDIGFGKSNGSEGLIPQTVFEVHWNDEYILAKRHPSGFGSPKINRSITEYYIIKKIEFGKEKAFPNLKGPLKLNEYIRQMDKLGLDEKKMESIIFDDLK